MQDRIKERLNCPLPYLAAEARDIVATLELPEGAQIDSLCTHTDCTGGHVTTVVTDNDGHTTTTEVRKCPLPGLKRLRKPSDII